jgi:hypothetical protein
VLRIVNLRPGRALRGKRWAVGWEGWGVLWKADTSKIVAPIYFG